MAYPTRFSLAVHILCLIELAGGEPVRSQLMAGSAGTHEVVVRRLLGRLRKAGLVDSKPGPGGGWTSRVPADALSLDRIYAASDEGDALAIHGKPNPACEVGRNIESCLTGVYGEAQKALEASLARHTLADVLLDLGRAIRSEQGGR